MHAKFCIKIASFINASMVTLYFQISIPSDIASSTWPSTSFTTYASRFNIFVVYETYSQYSQRRVKQSWNRFCITKKKYIYSLVLFREGRSVHRNRIKSVMSEFRHDPTLRPQITQIYGETFHSLEFSSRIREMLVLDNKVITDSVWIL